MWAAALANGGSLDNIQPGIDFWGKVSKAGNLLKVDPNSATIESGQTPIVLDWDYLNVTQADKVKASFDWKVAVPTDGLFAQYYAQAINKNAPHPAAARLWQEFLYSDEGQNLWLAGQVAPGAAQRDAAGGHGRQGGPRRAAAGRRASRSSPPRRRPTRPSRPWPRAGPPPPPDPL